MTTPNAGNAFMAKIVQNPMLLQHGCEDLFTQNIMSMQMDERFPNAMEVSTNMLADEFWDDDDEFISWLRPYNVVQGVLVIPVHGVLLNKVSVKFGSYMTGYDYIERAVARGMDDPDVTAIAFDLDSPGGEVAGNFPLAEGIASLRGEKPMYAYANDHAYSAAYSIASAADEIIISRSGGVGSVGVITTHMDVSGAMEQRGVKVTFIYAGEHKKDGNPYEALPAAVKARIQGRIDRLYGEFVGLVAANRGMDEQAVRDTEALTYDASDAITVGFADRLGSLDEDLTASDEEAQTENTTMALKPKATPTAATPTPAAGATFTQEQMDAAVAASQEEGMTLGAAAEQKRSSDIMGSEEAKTRPVAAAALVSSGMDADVAVAALGKMTPETASTPATPVPTEPVAGTPVPAPTPFAQIMDGPEVGANVAEEGADGQPVATTSDDMLGAYALMTGTPLPAKSA